MGRNSLTERQIAQHVTRWGNIHQKTLRALGLSRNSISVWCRNGRLVRMFHGVYAIGHAQRTPAARADAAVLACGSRAALSHDSAAALWGLRRWPRVPELSSAVHHKRRGIKAHRTTTLTRADVTVRDGIRVTTVARTIADTAPRLTDKQLTRAIHEARRNGDLTDPGLTRLRTDSRRIEQLIDPGQKPSESQHEDDFRAILRDFDLPWPAFQAYFHGHRVDAIYRRHKLIVELDSERDHGEWDRIEQDHIRDALALQYGFGTLRVTWRMSHDDRAAFARQLRAILDNRDPGDIRDPGDAPEQDADRD